jgi:hypothetical protein
MAINQPIPSIRLRLIWATGRRTDQLLFLLFFGGYAALIACFKYADVYHAHFSESGALILVNNLFRVLFVFYLFWIVQAAGAALLRLLGGAGPGTIGTLNYLALAFFTGMGAWHAVLLLFGFLNLLNVPVMVVLTAPAVALSFRELRRTAPGLPAALVQGFTEGSFLFRAALIALSLVWLTLLLVKGLYPAGGQDYFVQYSQVYQAFLDQGGVWPNEVWWHYFYSRGAGLFFLGMLLTDPLAPQLAMFCLFSVTGLVLFLFIRRLAPGTTWAPAGTLLFLGMYIYTPGWGEFGKLHEFSTSLVIATLWMATVALGESGAPRKAWLTGGASAMVAAIVINNTVAVFLGGMFAALALTYAWLGKRNRAIVCVGFASVAGALFAGNLLINFSTTGLLSGWDPSFPYLFRFADVEKLYRWGALPAALVLSQSYTDQVVPLIKSLNYLNFTSRFYLLWPLFLGGVAMAAVGIYARAHTSDEIPREHTWKSMSDAALVLLAAIVVFAALTVFAGRGISGSYYRSASFIVPVMIVAGIALWTAPLRVNAGTSLAAVAGHPATPLIVLALCAVVIAIKTPRMGQNIVPLTANALKYATGFLSIDDAYTHQSGGHPVGPWGGIYPGARGAYATVGPHVPIWSLHAETYCMLPDCKMMSFPHFLMTRAWDRVMWASPEQGRDALRAAGLNYFLFSRELPIRDPLFFSPLFSPDGIARYFGIRWTDGTTILLTWSGPETRPLDETWLAEYRRAVAASPMREFRSAAMKSVFERLNATPHPWRPADLSSQGQ